MRSKLKIEQFFSLVIVGGSCLSFFSLGFWLHLQFDASEEERNRAPLALFFCLHNACVVVLSWLAMQIAQPIILLIGVIGLFALHYRDRERCFVFLVWLSGWGLAYCMVYIFSLTGKQ